MLPLGGDEDDGTMSVDGREERALDLSTSLERELTCSCSTPTEFLIPDTLHFRYHQIRRKMDLGGRGVGKEKVFEISVFVTFSAILQISRD